MRLQGEVEVEAEVEADSEVDYFLLPSPKSVLK